jgi:hypothetical protein
LSFITLENHITSARANVTHHVNPVIRDYELVKLMIWKDGPQDKEVIDNILRELEELKNQSRTVSDIQFYLVQMDAYEILRMHLKEL